MRKPNCNCIICNKSHYRRPSELEKYDFVCCRECRSEAYKKYSNKKSIDNLKLGRVKGHCRNLGTKQSIETKLKKSISMKKWVKNNPEKVKEIGLKNRAENHYLWNGGINILNQKIRVMNDYRKWQNEVKDRDNRSCRECGSENELESHHFIELSLLIKKYNITSTEEARNCKELWDIDNGITLCLDCHYKVHGRIKNKQF